MQGNLGTVILVIAAALPNRHCCKVLRGTMQTYRQIITCTLLFTRTKIDNEVELPSDLFYDVFVCLAISLVKVSTLKICCFLTKPSILTRLNTYLLMIGELLGKKLQERTQNTERNTVSACGRFGRQ